jgi:hypothetical protein
MAKPIAYSSPAPTRPSPGSRGTLALVSAVLFAVCLVYYTAASLPDVVYRLLTDGPLLLAWLLAAWGYGWLALDPAGLLGRQREATLLRHVTRIAAGLGILSLLTLGLGLAGVLNQLTAIALLAGGFVVVIVAIAMRRAARVPASDAMSGWFGRSAGPHWLLLVLVPFAAIGVAGGLVPPGVLWGADDPAGYDVVEYHLQVPREWLDAGRIFPLEHNVFSYFPFNVEVHYLLGMHLHGGAWSGMYLAQWMHGAFVVLTLLAIYATVRTFATPLAACAATVAAGVCPWLTMLATVGYNEGGLLLYTTLAIAWLMRAFDLGRPGPAEIRDRMPDAPAAGTISSAIVAGLFAGFACGCKLTGVPMVLVALPVAALAASLIARGRPPVPRLLVAAGVYVLVGLVAFAPWLVRNQSWAGNPVFPEAMPTLGHGHFTPVQVERWHRAHAPRADQQSATARAAAFYQQVLVDWRYAYAILPAGVVAGAVAVRRPQAAFLLLSLAAFAAFWLAFTHLQSRFFVVAIPVVALLLAQLPRAQVGVAVLAAVAAVPALGVLHAKFAPLGIAFGLDSPRTLRDAVYPEDVNRAVNDEAQPLVLVGDAKAFWYDVPMARLHYRTVFDVDGPEGASVVRAWMGDAAGLPEATALVDPGELDRFSRTYYGIPPLPPALRSLDRITPIPIQDPRLK